MIARSLFVSEARKQGQVSEALDTAVTLNMFHKLSLVLRHGRASDTVFVVNVSIGRALA